MGYRTLRPGESISRSADLRSWVALDAPGRYVVECRFETQLVADPQQRAAWPTHAHACWDLALTGRVELRVVR